MIVGFRLEFQSPAKFCHAIICRYNTEFCIIFVKTKIRVLGPQLSHIAKAELYFSVCTVKYMTKLDAQLNAVSEVTVVTFTTKASST